MKYANTLKFNYIAHPSGGNQDQQDLASWIKSQRQNKRRTLTSRQEISELSILITRTHWLRLKVWQVMYLQIFRNI